MTKPHCQLKPSAASSPKKNIALFKADWTNRDETIRNALKTYGRNSIPLYVWYPAGKQTPVLLPQILTPDILKTQLQ